MLGGKEVWWEERSVKTKWTSRTLRSGQVNANKTGYHNTKVTRLLKEKKVLSLLRRGLRRADVDKTDWADGKALGHTSPGKSIYSNHQQLS